MLQKKNFEIELSPTKLPESAVDIGTEDESQTETTNIVEELLSRVGIGKFHWLTYAVISVFWICDGGEVIALSLLNYILVHVVWHLDLNEVGLIGSTIFGGFFIGSLISGPITIHFGRRKPFLIYMILVFVLGVLSAASPNFTWLVVTRGLYGILVGILSPLTSTMVTEITPKTKRGINFVLVTVFFTIGEIIAIFLAAALKVEETGSEKWRGLLIWVSIPALVSLILGYKYLEESPRYCLTKDANEGLRVLNLMHKINKKVELPLSDDEKEQLFNYVESQKEKHTDSPIMEIFAKENLRITINLWIAWWVLNFVYYGILYVLPLVLARIKASSNPQSEDKLSYLDLFISVLGEVPSYILVLTIIEKKSLGRKNSLTITFAAAAFCCFGAHLFVDSAFMLFVFLAKFFACSSFSFIYPLTSELYHTKCRTTGLGFASGVSRIGGIMMPWIILWALEISPTATFVTFGIFCVIGAISIAMLPYDTTGKELDQEH